MNTHCSREDLSREAHHILAGFQRALAGAGGAAESPPSQRAGSSASARPAGAASVGVPAAASPARPSPMSLSFRADGPLSSVPDVWVREITPADQFLLLACDGVCACSRAACPRLLPRFDVACPPLLPLPSVAAHDALV